jgi:hypothetical protein
MNMRLPCLRPFINSNELKAMLKFVNRENNLFYTEEHPGGSRGYAGKNGREAKYK